eukprot:TRINITY_DN106205_c0_g1_i1.p1 TRINITY_DN106205_c0_g1~~TRINITY_DN106205_c0_g1_i1.p1  ORF type:complete len:256 (+),score=93.68 TRINITY_DN106205_c0_g1_i1:86-853(+)
MVDHGKTKPTEMDEVFKAVIKELETKLKQIDTAIELDKVASRKELALYCWKTGRVVRQLVKPESSKDRDIFWHECKGILKDVLELQRWNAGVFTEEGVRTDVLEKDVSAMLQKLIGYIKKRASGETKAPDRKVTAEEAKRKKEEQEEQSKLQESCSKCGEAFAKEAKFCMKCGQKREQKEEESDMGWGSWSRGGWQQGWKRGRKEAGDWWGSGGGDEGVVRRRWDEEDSDPDEPCPIKARFGSCDYGQQCGFCYR